MTMKNIALAFLALPAVMASESCRTESTEATQSHFSVELAGGGSTMNGHVLSNTGNPNLPTPKFQDINFTNVTQVDLPNIQVDVPMDFIIGYRANWYRMSPLPSLMSFAGQFNMHYNYVCNKICAGVFVGVGLNTVRSSSIIPASFNPTIQTYLYQDENTYNAGITNTVNQEKMLDIENNAPSSPLRNRIQRTLNISMGRATVFSNLMFQAGARLGVMVGNVFPHIRAGWAIYQFKAHMTNQRPPWTNAVAAQAKSTLGNVINPQGRVVNLDANNSVYSIGVGQYMNVFDDAYTMPEPIKISSKSQWTNAVTLGAGVDWAFNRMTLGFFYQVGICQKLTFKKWNKDVTAGLTAVDADYIGTSAVTIPADERVPTGGYLKMHYGKSQQQPEVRIRPVMQTLMLNVKYVVGKAA